MQGNHKTKKMKSPITLSGKELVRLPDTSQYFRTRAIRYSDPGIMRDEVAIKIPLLGEVHGTTRSLMLVPVAVGVVGLGVYVAKCKIKRDNDIKIIQAKKQAELELYEAKKKADRLYGKTESETEDSSSTASEVPCFSEPQPLDDMVKKAATDPTIYRRTQFRIDGFVYYGDLVVFYSHTGAGKSIAATQFGFSISEGTLLEFLRTTPSKQPVYYFDSELSEADYLNRYGENKEHLPHDFYHISVKKNILPEACLDELRKYCDKQQGDFTIFVDNITTMFRGMGREDNATTIVNGILGLQKEMLEKRNILLTVFLLAHTTKDGDLRGTGLWSVGVPDVIRLERPDETKNRYLLKSDKCRNAGGGFIWLEKKDKPYPHFVRIEAPHATKVEGSVHPSQQPALTPEQKEAVKALYKGGKTISQIAEEYHVSPATIHKTIHGGKKGKKGSKKH